MQLRILRDQNEKGMLKKKISFILNAKLEFREEEADAINKYNMGPEMLYYDEGNRDMTMSLNILSAGEGKTFECKDIGDVLDIEELVMNACQIAKTRVEAAQAFGGEEVIEF